MSILNEELASRPKKKRRAERRPLGVKCSDWLCKRGLVCRYWSELILKRLKFMEVEPMIEALKSAVKVLAKKIDTDVKPDEALKFTQAALNAAHAIVTLEPK